jgi:hypothetical protein
MKQWASFLSLSGGTYDGILRALSIVLVGVILLNYSTIFEVEYNSKLIDLYTQPWWRLMLILLTISAAMWCPRVGILITLLVFFYLADMETLITPLANH